MQTNFEKNLKKIKKPLKMIDKFDFNGSLLSF